MIFVQQNLYSDILLLAFLGIILIASLKKINHTVLEDHEDGEINKMQTL